MTTKRQSNHSSRHRILWIVVALPLLALVAASISVGQQFRQEALDRALIQAVKKLDPPAVNRLLSEGASANARDAGEPPLTVSRLLQRLLARLKYKPGGVPDGSRKTVLALHLSRDDFYPGGDIAECITSADNIAVMLISHGSEINIRDDRQSTPIQIAVYRGFHQTARVLLSRGVDLNARDDCDYTALVLADDEGRKLLLDHNVNVNAKAAGMPPLMYAVYSGNVNAIALLLRHGAAVNATDENGLSNLYHAEVFIDKTPDGQVIVRLLKQHGARLNQKDKEALTRNRIQLQ